MTRTIVSQNELLLRLNVEMAKQHLCTGCMFTSITTSGEQDADGCNWSSAVFCCGSHGTPPAVCAPKANQAIAQARALFNVD